MNKAVGYARVSDPRDTEGIDQQGEKIRAMVELRDAELVEIVADVGHAATRSGRPGLARVVEMVDEGAVDSVIVSRLDRLSRSTHSLGEMLEHLDRRSVSLVAIHEFFDTESITGQVVQNVLGQCPIFAILLGNQVLEDKPNPKIPHWP